MNIILIKKGLLLSFLNFRIYLLVLILFLSFVNPVLGQKADTFLLNEKTVRIIDFDSEINKIIKEVEIPALSLAIIDNDRVVFSSSYGYKKSTLKKAVNPRTIFEAASLSKVFLSMIAHKLVDKGILDLDRPMCEYLKYAPLEHDPRYKLITPRMILAHCSGIENWKQEHKKDILEILANPGEKFVYSGEGYQYLAAVIASVLHEPYDRYVSRMILKPLHLKRTYLRYRKSKINVFRAGATSNFATGHNYFGEGVKKWKNKKSVPSSGINTTAKDYAIFFTSTFNNSYLSSDSYRDLLKPVVEISRDSTMYMGDGLALIYGKKDTIVGFSGSNTGFKSQIFYSPKKKRGFVFLTNSDRGNMIISRLNELTAELDINFLFSNTIQYPSVAIDILRTYRENNADAVILEINKLNQEEKLNVATLNELSQIFRSKDKSLSKKISAISKAKQ